MLGGGSRFGATQLDAVRRLILYADTVLIPDPVLAWIEETPRPEERFAHIQLLEAMFFLLRLKPLVDCASAYPPVIVFPSFERTLAQQDIATQGELEQFYLGCLLSSLSGKGLRVSIKSSEYAGDRSRLSSIQSRLSTSLLAPVDRSTNHWMRPSEGSRREVRRYRSDEHVVQLEERCRKGPALSVGVATMERLEPQFHLMQNELN